MSIIQLHPVTVTRAQVDIAMQMMVSTHGEGKPVTIEEVDSQKTIWVTMRDRNQMEVFLLHLAMIVSGDALAGEVSKMPTVVDAQDVILNMAVFHDALNEYPGYPRIFVLKLKTA